MRGLLRRRTMILIQGSNTDYIMILKQFSYFYRCDYENKTISFNYILFECIKVSLPRDSYAKRGICRRRVSVCLCVCLSHSGIVSKQLNVGSRKQRRTIAP